ncbi:MAG: helix-turn-helix transcriptional regulator [Gammaproteobacteria bacterium]|nr:helix-turn-helix transcriptional regulator [Gammaproteobacteria bacterium]
MQKTLTDSAPFGRILKFWRAVRKLSQEELAFRIDSAARHISRLEKGQAQPSKEMIHNIANALELSNRDTINLLFSAGYVSKIQGNDIHSEDNIERKQEIVRHLKALEPLPAVLTDITGNILAVNRAWLGLQKILLPEKPLEDISNLFECLFEFADKQVTPQHWQTTLCVVLLSIQQNVLYHDDENIQSLLNSLLSSSSVPKDWQEIAASQPPASRFAIEVLIDNQVESFSIFTQTINVLGPLAFSASPDMVSIVFHPDNERLDLSPLIIDDYKHPLLFY